MEKLSKLLIATKNASVELAKLNSEEKNQALLCIADSLVENVNTIVEANKIDLLNGEAKGLGKAMLNRLELTEDKIVAIANDVRKIAELKDPVNEVIEEVERPNGLVIKKVRVPFGVICAIYESRPNVSIDIACLSLKTSNACILRGGSEAINSNIVLVTLMRQAISNIVNPDVITLITDTDRALVKELITAKQYVDLVIPRGGKALIQNIVTNATVPFIETGAGNCHLYVDKDADINQALSIAINAKVSRPAVCNSIETLLVDEAIAKDFLPKLKDKFDQYKVLIRGCNKTREIIDVLEATEEDYFTEYNDYIIAIKVVKNIDEAIKHINHYGTKHSETIVTKSKTACEKFLNEIDSACVYLNASTRFSDGGEFGFGAELGISTQKLHARGPMGLKEMTTYKYKIYGEGQIR